MDIIKTENVRKMIVKVKIMSKYASVKILSGENIVWSKYYLVKISYGQNIICMHGACPSGVCVTLSWANLRMHHTMI